MFEKLKAKARPTFLEATFANRVLGFLNAIMTARVVPSGAGKFVCTENAVVLDLSSLQAADQAARIQALEKALAASQGQITAINKALRSATITCADGNVVLTIPGLP